MLFKVFSYLDIKHNTYVYLNGPDDADPINFFGCT